MCKLRPARRDLGDITCLRSPRFSTDCPRTAKMSIHRRILISPPHNIREHRVCRRGLHGLIVALHVVRMDRRKRHSCQSLPCYHPTKIGCAPQICGLIDHSRWNRLPRCRQTSCYTRISYAHHFKHMCTPQQRHANPQQQPVVLEAFAAGRRQQRRSGDHNNMCTSLGKHYGCMRRANERS